MAIKIQNDIVIYDTKVFKVGSGTTAERPNPPLSGMIRYNTTVQSFEGYRAAGWNSLGGARGGGGDEIFWENDKNITTSYTISENKYAGTFGPVVIDNPAVITVPDSSNWTVDFISEGPETVPIDVVRVSATQTLISKTIDFDTNTLINVAGLTNTQTISNKTFSTNNLLESAVKEKTTIVSSAASGTINIDVLSQQIVYYTSNSTGNFTVNIRGDSGTTLNNIMNTGDMITVALFVTNGTTAYYNTTVQIDGTTRTVRWADEVPTKGNASAVDGYTYGILKTANATFTIFAVQNKNV